MTDRYVLTRYTDAAPGGEIIYDSEKPIAPPVPLPPISTTIDPESGIDYKQFLNDADLTAAQAQAKLANAVDYRDGKTPAPVIGGMGIHDPMVGSNPPWNGRKATGGKGWSWPFYEGPNVRGYPWSKVPQVIGASPGPR